MELLRSLRWWTCGSVVASVASLAGLTVFALGGCTGDPPLSTTSAADDAGTNAADAGAQPGTDAAVACEAPKTVCGSVCIDTATNADHCGKCGRSCGVGSTCEGGRCAPIVLADKIEAPSAMAVGASFVLAASSSGIARCGKEGCAQGVSWLWTETTWRMVEGSLALDPTGYALALGYPPDTTDVRIFRAAAEGAPFTAPQVFAGSAGSLLNNSYAIAADDREYFFASPYRVQRCLYNSDCTAPVRCNDLETPSGITLTPSHYVWTMQFDSLNAAVLVCPRPAAGAKDYAAASCDEPTVLAPLPIDQSSARMPIVWQDIVYWAEVPPSGVTSRVLSCPLAGCDGKPKTIAKSEATISGLAVDSSGAYWTSGTAGTVRVCRDLVAGCDTKAETLAVGATNPAAIGLDEKYAYYATKGTGGKTGSILKIAK